MRGGWWLAAVAWMALSATPAAAAERAVGGAPPAIEIEPPAADFGRVPRGEVRKIAFEVHNRGGSKLVIREVEPTCACTVASFDGEIAPGETGRIQASFDSHGFSGPVTRGLTVVTNDPKHRILFLELRADVVGSVLVYPHDDVRLGNYRSLSRQAVVLLRQDPTETSGTLSLGEVRASDESILVRVERLEGPRSLPDGLPAGRAGDWLVHLELAPETPPGSSRHELFLTTGLEAEPEISLPVWVQVLPVVTLTDERLVLSAAEPGQATRGALQGVLRMGHDPAALRVEADPPALGLSLEWTGPRQFRLQASAAPGAALPADGGRIVFRVDAEVYSIPFVVAAVP